MIHSVRGTLIYTDPKTAVVDCGGVGFRCNATHKTLAQLPPLGNEVMLYTYQSVRMLWTFTVSIHTMSLTFLN